MTAENKMLLIRNFNLWRHVSDEEYEHLNICHRFIEAKKGEYIYFEAFHHKKIYFIKDGHIRIGYIDESGNEVIREILSKGELFGQFTLEKDNMNGEFARAYKADVSLCAFDIDDFRKLLERRPDIAIRYSGRVAHKLKHSQDRLISLLSRDVKSRLIHFFWQLLQEEQAPGKQQVAITNYFTHEDIAHLIGASRQTVSSLITELADEQLVQVTRQQIRFPDVKKIQNLVTVA